NHGRGHPVGGRSRRPDDRRPVDGRAGPRGRLPRADPEDGGQRMRRAVVLAAALAVLLACAPRVQDPGPAAADPHPPAVAEAHYTTPDGVSLPLRRWEAEGPPEAVVLALHGFNDYSDAFSGIGPWLADRGVSVFA